jgi:hypothetical protein
MVADKITDGDVTVETATLGLIVDGRELNIQIARLLSSGFALPESDQFETDNPGSIVVSDSAVSVNGLYGKKFVTTGPSGGNSLWVYLASDGSLYRIGLEHLPLDPTSMDAVLRLFDQILGTFRLI